MFTTLLDKIMPRTGEEAAVVHPKRELGEGMESSMPFHAGDDHVLVKVGLNCLAAVEVGVEENGVALEFELAARWFSKYFKSVSGFWFASVLWSSTGKLYTRRGGA